MTADAANVNPVEPVPDRIILRVVVAYAATFVVFGFVVDGPAQVLHGLFEIVTTRDALLTDYFGIGGIGAGCVNAGLLTLCACLVYRLADAKITGAAVACLFLVLGFGLFGKNLLNIWSIVLGVLLYARFKGEPFSAHINTAFFGAALAPVFSEILFSTTLALEVRVPLAVITSLVIGFILAPAAAQLFKAHMGFSLYNMGFAAGIVGTLVVATYKSYGFVADPVMIWTTGNNRLLGGFLALVFGSMVAVGYYLDRSLASRLKQIMATTGQAPTDFIALAGFGPTLANMGLTGTIGTIYVLLVGGDLNGPVIGAILTIVGFSAFGKHPRNIVPIMIGVFIAFARQAVERRRSVDPAGSTVRHDARADRRALRLALGHRGRRRAFVSRDERRRAARGPQSVQQWLRRRHRRRCARPGHHRHQGRTRRRPGPGAARFEAVKRRRLALAGSGIRLVERFVAATGKSTTPARTAR